MKRKLFYLLALMMSTSLLLSPAVAHAEETESEVEQVKNISAWSDYHFENASIPSKNTELVFSDSLGATTSEDDLAGFTLASGKYKVLTYDGVVYGTKTVSATIPADEEFDLPAQEYTYETLVAYDNPNDLSTILEQEPIRSKGSYIKTLKNPEAYLLFFKYDASSVNDLKFACKIADLENYTTDRYEDDVVSLISTTAKSSVSLVEKIYDNNTEYCTTGKFKVNFNLGEVKVNGVGEQELALCLVIDNGDNIDLSSKNSGEVEFIIKNLENKTYSYYIKSNNGNKYTGEFIVDFVKISEDDTIVTSNIVPDVTFSGQPSEKIYSGTKVTLNMNTSNIDSMMNFNGVILGNGAYGKSFDFTVTQNGTYAYSATTVDGKLSEGKFTVDFFEGVIGDDIKDPINSELTDAYGISSLVQTGLEYSPILFVIAGLLILTGIIVLLSNRFIFRGRLFRKDGVTNENEK